MEITNKTKNVRKGHRGECCKNVRIFRFVEPKKKKEREKNSTSTFISVL